MRKRIVTRTPATVQARREGWLDLEHAATVEVASEDKDFPIESSLSIEPTQGWRAAEPGAQTIRLLFDQPQELKRISLVFEEDEIILCKSCCCEHCRILAGRFERLCVSNGISAHLRQPARARNTVSNFRRSPYLS